MGATGYLGGDPNKLNRTGYAKGDLPAADATGALQPVPIGTTGNVLTVNAGQPELLDYEPAGGGGGGGTPSNSVVTEQTFGQAPTAGAAVTYSRGDHTHGTPASPAVPGPAITVVSETAFGQAQAVGTGALYARNDHTHGTPAAPTAASVGAVPTTRLISTTAPIAGGGDLSADRTISLNDAGVTNAKLANMAANTVKGSVAGGVPADLSVAQQKTILALAVADVSGAAPIASPTFTGTVGGITAAMVGAAPTGRLISTTAPLAGGGDLSADRTLSLSDAGVTNAKLANMAANTVKGSVAGGVPADLSVAQQKTILALVVADVSGAAPLASPALTGTATAVNLTQSGRYLMPWVVLTDAATVAINAALGNRFRLTLTGTGHTLGAPSNPSDGQMFLVEVIQAAGGGNTLALASGAGGYVFGTGIASFTMTATASKRDYLLFLYNLAADRWALTGLAQGY